MLSTLRRGSLAEPALAEKEPPWFYKKELWQNHVTLSRLLQSGIVNPDERDEVKGAGGWETGRGGC